MTIILLEFLVVLAAIFIGARVGGIGLGIFGMMGLAVLVFGFGIKPGEAPIDVMLMILAVITAAAAASVPARTCFARWRSEHAAACSAAHISMACARLARRA